MDWPSHKTPALHAQALSQQSQRHLHRRHQSRRPRPRTLRHGRRRRRLRQRWFPRHFISCVGQSRLFHNTGKGVFTDVTQKPASSTSRASVPPPSGSITTADGLLDLFVCNYVRWSADHDVFCSLDGKNKSYCTPEAYRGDTCWLLHNRGDGTFEDVTSPAASRHTSSKSLGVAMLDFDQDGWPISSSPTTPAQQA